jgi:hypothetical protein
MDPNANLEAQRRIVARIIDLDATAIDPVDAVALADLVQALDEWLTRGGFLPAEWQR